MKPVPDKNVDILDSSSVEDNENPTQQEKEEGTERKSNEKQAEQDTN